MLETSIEVDWGHDDEVVSPATPAATPQPAPIEVDWGHDDAIVAPVAEVDWGHDDEVVSPVATQLEDMGVTTPATTPPPGPTKPTEEEHQEYRATRPEPQESRPSYTYNDMFQDVALQNAIRGVRVSGWQQDPNEYSAEDNVRDYTNYMRNAMTNEVSALKLLTQIQDSDDTAKENWRVLFDRYDKLPDFWQEGGAPTSEVFLDLVEAAVTSPSTWLSIFTGGGSKVAGLGAATAARAAARGAVMGGAVDALAAGGTDLAYQAAEIEAGHRDTTDWTQVGVSTGLGAAPGAIGGGLQARSVQQRSSQLAQQVAKGHADRLAQQTVAVRQAANAYTPDLDPLRGSVKEDLEKFFADESVRGRELIDMVGPSSALLEPALREDVFTGITVAVKNMMEAGNFKLSPDKELRVGWQVYQAMEEGVLDTSQFNKALQDVGLTPDDFKTLFWSEASRSGKILNRLSQLKRASNNTLANSSIRHYLGDQADDVLAKLNGEVEQAGWLRRNLAKLDQTRIGMMITQPATAARNVAGAVGYIGMEAGARGIDNVMAAATGSRPVKWLDMFDVVGSVLNHTESRMLAEELTRLDPKKHQLLFKTYNEVNRTLGKSTGPWKVVDTVVDALNVFNRFQDHVFRQAAFVSSVGRQLNDLGMPPVETFIRDGRLAEIDKPILDRAMHEAMRTTFTDEPTNKAATEVLGAIRKWNENVPFTLTSVIPFPRFILSALKFQYEYSPFGLTSRELWKKAGQGDYHDVGKVIVGSGLLGAAYLMRDSEHAGMNWYDMVGSDGRTYDMRPYFPIAPYLYVADQIKRMGEGTFNWEDFSSDTLEAVGGISFRQNMDFGTLDTIFKSATSGGDVGEGGLRALGEAFANIGSSFLIPSSTVRDIQAQFDPSLRYMRDSRGEGLWDTIANRMDERLPDLDLGPLGEVGRQNLPHRQSVLTGPTTRYQDPLIKQMTGLNAFEAPNPIQQEFARLGMEEFDIFQSSGNREYDRAVMYHLGNLYQRHATNSISTGWYQNLTPDQQRLHLQRLPQQKILFNRWSMNEFSRDLANVVSPEAALKVAYNRIPANERRVHEEYVATLVDPSNTIEYENALYRLYFGVGPHDSVEDMKRYFLGIGDSQEALQMQELMRLQEGQ